MKGDSYGRRFSDWKPISARFLSDEHAPDLSDHDNHLRDVLRADPRGFPWKVRNETSTSIPHIHRAHTEASPAKRGRFFA